MIQTILSSATKGVPKIKPGTRYHVCGEVLDKGDFNTLKNQNWLNDKVFNKYHLEYFSIVRFTVFPEGDLHTVY